MLAPVSVVYVAFRSVSRCFPIVSIALLGMMVLNSPSIVVAANVDAANSRSYSVWPELAQESGRISSLSRYLDQHAAADQAVDVRWAAESKAMMVWVQARVRTQAKTYWKQFIVSDMVFRWQKQFRQAQQFRSYRDGDDFRSAAPKDATQRASHPIALSPIAGAVSVLARIQASDWNHLQQFAGPKIAKTFWRLESSCAKASEIIAAEFHDLADRISGSVVNRTLGLVGRLAASPKPEEWAFLAGAAKLRPASSDDYWQYYADCDRWQVEFEFEPVEGSR